MICYMPFIDIEEPLLDGLTAALGPVTIYCPSPEMVSESMLAASRESRLDLRYAHGIDPSHLALAFQEFRAWADLHGGSIADLSGLSRTMQGGAPLVDDTNPTAIGDQVRHFGEQNPQEAADPIFRAALFLAMAQQFDRQQVAVTRDLGEVHALERLMLARLSGDEQDPEQGTDALPDAGAAAGLSDIGGFMTARRVQSWAELASRDTESRHPILYVTSSPAVLEHLLDHFGQAQGPLRARLDTGAAGDGRWNRKVVDALERMASAEDPAAVTADCFEEDGAGTHSVGLTIYALAGILPLDFPHRLLADRNPAGRGSSRGGGTLNTLIGLMEK